MEEAKKTTIFTTKDSIKMDVALKTYSIHDGEKMYFTLPIYHYVRSIDYDSFSKRIWFGATSIRHPVKVFFEQLRRHVLTLLWDRDAIGNEHFHVVIDYDPHVTEKTLFNKNSILTAQPSSGVYDAVIEVEYLTRRPRNRFELKCSIYAVSSKL